MEIRIIKSANTLALLFTCSFLQGQYANNQIKKYQCPGGNTVSIPCNYADANLNQLKALERVDKQKIYLIELVYTQYRRSSSFDQKSLNDKRIANLKASISGINDADVKWKVIEQTGARSAKEASSYFHGFVIHYTGSLDYKGLKVFLNSFQSEFELKDADNTQKQTFTYASGTKVHVPSNAITYKNGKPVNGAYVFKYREFKNAAQVAFSGIPMVYSSAGQNYRFNSVGMYEIRAEQNGEELKLNKPITVDFQCNKGAKDVGFFQLDDQKGEWKKLKDNVMQQPNVMFKKNKPKKKVDRPQDVLSFTHVQTNPRHYYFSDTSWVLVKAELLKEPKWKGRLTNFSDSKKEFYMDSMYHDELDALINRSYIPYFRRWNNFGSGNATLLAEGADQGHTYPDVVKGLNSEDFGVYNCDQIYQLQNPQTITPKFVDNSNTPIKNGHVACLIDLNFNGSFSFNPASISLEKNGRNVILLFTENKKIYLISESAMKRQVLSNNPTLVMMDMSSKIKTSEDLKKILNLGS